MTTHLTYPRGSRVCGSLDGSADNDINAVDCPACITAHDTPPMRYTGTMEALYSRRDRNGNTYWALRYTCHASGRTVCGTVSGGESNIGVAAQHLDAPDYGRTLQRTQDFPIREFNRMTKTWEYAGCDPREIAEFIRRKLSETV